MTKRAFGELELAILQLFKSGSKMTVRDVHQALGGLDKYTTIMTVMNRLAEKNRLGRERIGLQYEYWILASHMKTPSLLEQLKQKLFGVKTSAMVSYLIETADDISEDDLLEMEKLIKQTKEKRKTK